jgi:hypothetical protein
MGVVPQIVAASVLIGVVGLAAYATVRIWRDRLLDRGQRVAQTVFVWLIPVIGGLVVIWLLRDEKLTLRRHEEPGNEDGTLL